jgi:hypothetical protein
MSAADAARSPVATLGLLPRETTGEARRENIELIVRRALLVQSLCGLALAALIATRRYGPGYVGYSVCGRNRNAVSADDPEKGDYLRNPGAHNQDDDVSLDDDAELLTPLFRSLAAYTTPGTRTMGSPTGEHSGRAPIAALTMGPARRRSGTRQQCTEQGLVAAADSDIDVRSGGMQPPSIAPIAPRSDTLPYRADGLGRQSPYRPRPRRYCASCDCAKPDRAHHCRVCKRCVMKSERLGYCRLLRQPFAIGLGT